MPLSSTQVFFLGGGNGASYDGASCLADLLPMVTFTLLLLLIALMLPLLLLLLVADLRSISDATSAIKGSVSRIVGGRKSAGVQTTDRFWGDILFVSCFLATCDMSDKILEKQSKRAWGLESEMIRSASSGSLADASSCSFVWMRGSLKTEKHEYQPTTFFLLCNNLLPSCPWNTFSKQSKPHEFRQSMEWWEQAQQGGAERGGQKKVSREIWE